MPSKPTDYRRPRSKPTIGDVAGEAGVSIATVSRVINGIANKASPDTRRDVMAAVERLGYRPVHAGRSLRMKQSPLTAFLIPDTANLFYAAMADAVASRLQEGGSAMILCNTREDPVVQDAYLLEMASHLVNGVALFGAVDSPMLKRVIDDGLPVVFVNRRAPDGVDGPYVGIDNERAGREIAEQFLRRRWLPCGVIHGPLSSSASRERFAGFRERLAQSGEPLAPRLVMEAGLTIESGYRAAVQLLDAAALPRAVFCGNDLIAYGLHRRCAEMGIGVPERLAIFGFDDNPLNEWLAPWLNTVRVPYDDFGRTLARMFERLGARRAPEWPGQTLLPHRLVIRCG